MSIVRVWKIFVVQPCCIERLFLCTKLYFLPIFIHEKMAQTKFLNPPKNSIIKLESKKKVGKKMRKRSLSFVFMLLVSLFMTNSVNAAELTIPEGYYQYTGESMVEGISISDNQVMLIYDTATEVEEDPLISLLLKWGNAVTDGLTGLINPNMKPSEEQRDDLPLIELITYDQVVPFPKLAIVIHQPSLYNDENILRIRVGNNTQFEWEFNIEENGDLTDKDGHTFTYVEEVEAESTMDSNAEDETETSQETSEE